MERHLFGRDEHSWGPVHQTHEPFNAHHGRHCKKCGLHQGYGYRFGSRRYAMFETVSLDCDDNGLGQKNQD